MRYPPMTGFSITQKWSLLTDPRNFSPSKVSHYMVDSHRPGMHPSLSFPYVHDVTTIKFLIPYMNYTRTIM